MTNGEQPRVGRRGLLGIGLGVGAAVALPHHSAEAEATDMRRGGSRAFGDSKYVDTGIADLRRLLATGQTTSVELTSWYLRRIERMNRKGPALHAVIETNPEALKAAAGLDAERRGGRVRGPLHGVPMLIKDDLETADAMHTTCGAFALMGCRPERDATNAARLRAAGVVLLGKANMSEWAGGMTIVHRPGWSARGGQCRNPYRLDRSPSESSSGTAAGVSASLAAAGLGTESNGSILLPSSANGVVGIKPTVGLTSRAGVIPGTVTFDSVGPICRTVADAALVLGALVGVDPRDPATSASAGRFHRDYTRFLDRDGLRGARIGVPRQVYFGYSDHADAIAETAIEAMRAAGATIVDPADFPNAQQLEEPDATALVMAYEVKHYLDAYLAATPGDHPRSIAEVIEFNREHADLELRYFPQNALEYIDQLSGDLSEPAYHEARSKIRRLSREEGIDAVLRKHRLDALVMPTAPPPVKIDLINGDHYLGGSSTPAALAGYPAVNVPAGYVFGLPVGLTFMGTAWSEPTLIRLAYSFEQTTHARRTPRYEPGDVLA